MKCLRHATRLLLTTLFVVGGAVGARAGIKSERVLAAIIQNTPAPRLVAEGEQLKTAEKLAATIPGAQALWGVGHSMEPLYASNTAVIVVAIDFNEIKKGMTLVYMKSNGRRVAHSVVGEMRGGFITQGVNNDEQDAELVTPDNLIGVVAQAFASADTSFRTDRAKQMAAKNPNKPADRS